MRGALTSTDRRTRGLGASGCCRWLARLARCLASLPSSRKKPSSSANLSANPRNSSRLARPGRSTVRSIVFFERRDALGVSIFLSREFYLRKIRTRKICSVSPIIYEWFFLLLFNCFSVNNPSSSLFTLEIDCGKRDLCEQTSVQNFLRKQVSQLSRARARARSILCSMLGYRAAENNVTLLSGDCLFFPLVFYFCRVSQRNVFEIPAA